ncbi:MAG: FKBP-type peptidyl-prolyl cis-trans isomerase [Flavobacteriales bacterium]|jgi:peptidylprolyl isomerase|nr:FKBP-type peptidyl-prolyl cis-trans isomerase [Flavobacteriales bacterium]MBT3964687.1 FKBP-type peptidyl-prolyl cis-trans isomerase [Flavobacteriales bacterium]MBT4705350.1 FKBP-type peptidyl-prolyl cis-trans isomerase [Flavobacteriales bacterium]MBT4929899.1 FKBP-type peptidyl-prolyl cis-trans isomerase [Flavobacteriales bacterium]MBT5132273.1 FKBP-type peptidyl-prolyl cis-trans isomerase [Flavobacteriales bacterium]
MNMKRLFIGLGLVALIASGCDQGGSTTEDGASGEVDQVEEIVLPSGLKIEIAQKGDGILPQVGQRVSVHYRGTLEDGTPFDNSYDRGQPYTFPIGKRQVIQGWDEGIAQLSTGAKAKLTVPSELAYGEAGRPGIPPNSTLIFEVELVEIKQAPVAITHEPWPLDGVELQQTNSGLKYYIVEEGTGPQAQAGKIVKVHYYGYLKANGNKFDGSFERGEPIEFPLGQGMVIPGWEEGLALLKEGTKAVLVIPSYLAYGDEGRPPVIPPQSDLVFDVELVGVN